MKKLILALAAVSLCAALLAGCSQPGSSSSQPASDSGSSSVDASQDSTAPEGDSGDAGTEDVADTERIESIVAAIEAVNPISNPRVIDDFELANAMGLNADDIVAFKGDVTNDQADCGLVFVAQAKTGKVEDVKAGLEAYKESLSANDMYVENADKNAKAQDARIVVKDNLVILVLASVSGPEYSEIDTAIENALA